MQAGALNTIVVTRIRTSVHPDHGPEHGPSNLHLRPPAATPVPLQGQTSQTWTWHSVPCAPQAQSDDDDDTFPLRLRPRATPAGEWRAYGSLTAPTVPIVDEGWTVVTFGQFSGESDSMNGTDAFSIQLNTLPFINSTGQSSWGQVQQTPRACVRVRDFVLDLLQVDLTLAGPSNKPDAYRHTCVATPLQTLSSTYQAGIQGAVRYSLLGCIFRPSHRCFWGYLMTSTYYVDGPSPPRPGR